MLNVNYLTISIFFFFLINNSLLAQEIYPGDVNNNGIVNGIDLLYLGVAFGSTGPNRNNEGTNWTPYMIDTFWPQSFENGLNFAYADCDGNGEIEDDDLDEAIKENYGLSHSTNSFPEYTTGSLGNIPISLVPTNNILEAGTTLDLNVVLGNADIPVQNFYGLAFRFSYNSDLVDNNFDYDSMNDSWLDPEPGNQIKHLVVLDNNGKGEIALTRKNQIPIQSGFGTVGVLSIIIEDDIASGLEVDTLNITIDSILMVDLEMNAIPVSPVHTSVIIKENILISNHSTEKEKLIKVFPNPAKNLITVQSSQIIETTTLINASGSVVIRNEYKTNTPPQNIQIETQSLSTGVYFLNIYSEDGNVYTKKIIVL